MSDGDVCEPDTAGPHLRAYARVFPASVQLGRLCEFEVCGEVNHIENESAIPQDIGQQFQNKPMRNAKDGLEVG